MNNDMRCDDMVEALRESEAKYRSLFTENSLVMLLIDPSTGRLVDANQAASDYYGYPLDKLTRLRITDIDMLSLDEVKAKMEQTIAGVKRSFSSRHRLASGEVRDVEIFSGPITVDGRPLLYSIVHDVTGNKQTEKMLRESEARYRELFHAMREGVVVMELILVDGKITDWIYEDYNSAYLELIGLAPGTNIRGKRGSEVIGQDLAKVYLPTLERMRGPEADMQLRYTSPISGRELLASSVAEGDRIVIAFTDITDLRRTEEDLRRSNYELQQFAYVASHDLQEPLRMVTSYIGLLNKKFGDQLDPKAKEYMSYAAEGSHRMRELIDDLLAYSRIDSQSTVLEEIDMNDKVRAVIEDLHVAIGEIGAEVVVNPLPKICGDRTQMKQLMTNLISNAIKFHRDDEVPRIEISAVTFDDKFVFSVRDNGIGIDPKYQEKLFKMFSRLHTREEYPGTGIGLAISKKIVERHGGKIWFESEPG
ncbi:MAG TPA: PAS domain S-box protein, partial [Bacillus bacterium]|nr:PAS domain S-box protein [Bacillus sp. (in: firmicutes)]